MTVIIDWSGKIVSAENGGEYFFGEKDSKPFSFKYFCYTALFNTPPEPETPEHQKQQQKFDRGMLAAKVLASGESIELDSGDVKTIKDCVGRYFNSNAIVFQCWNLLEGKASGMPQEIIDEADRKAAEHLKPEQK